MVLPSLLLHDCKTLNYKTHLSTIHIFPENSYVFDMAILISYFVKNQPIGLLNANKRRAGRRLSFLVQNL